MPGDVAVPWTCKSAVPPLCWFIRDTTDLSNPSPSTSPTSVVVPSTVRLLLIVTLSENVKSLATESNIPPFRTVTSSPLNERPTISTVVLSMIS